MATIEQRLHRQEMRRQKDIEVCSDFKSLQLQYPDIEVSTLFDTLADKYRKGEMKLKGIAFPTSGMGVRDIIIRHGLYTPRKQNSNRGTNNA